MSGTVRLVLKVIVIHSLHGEKIIGYRYRKHAIQKILTHKKIQFLRPVEAACGKRTPGTEFKAAITECH